MTGRPMSDQQTPAERETAIREALGLARSMIACGEKMTPRAEAAFDKARDAARAPEHRWADDEWHTDEKGQIIGGAPPDFVFVAKSALEAVAARLPERPDGKREDARVTVGLSRIGPSGPARLPERPDEESDDGSLDQAVQMANDHAAEIVALGADLAREHDLLLKERDPEHPGSLAFQLRAVASRQPAGENGRAELSRAKGLAEAVAQARPYPVEMDGVRGVAAEIATLLDAALAACPPVPRDDGLLERLFAYAYVQGWSVRPGVESRYTAPIDVRSARERGAMKIAQKLAVQVGAVAPPVPLPAEDEGTT